MLSRRTLLRLLPLTALLATTPLPAQDRGEQARWARHAAAVTIVRDDWGIAHVTGRTDADAVFGMIYAQAEDDFPRIEANYLTSLGRMAEAEGQKAIWQDLRQRLFIDPDVLKADYARSPAWLKTLMNAWADGLNHFLATHPDVRPRVLTRFEPWMALSFSEGSIGGDIERVPLSQLEAFYGRQQVAWTADELGRVLKEPSGSNGIAIAPKLTEDGHAMLLINPHTSFYFRSEQQVTSGEGLNAYGAATWGQFFIYQGFNRRLGWMHTSSTVDNVDEFAETVTPGQRPTYRYGNEQRAVTVEPITLRFRAADGSMASRTFTTYATHHGPVIRAEGAKWISMALMNRPLPALQQSFLRTKATSFADYLKVAEFQANSSNNTLYADADGTIAYLHPQFVPVRDNRFDYTKPVDGSDPATDWKGLHSLPQLPQVVNPGTGWAMNTNNWPWSAAGPDSPKASAFPRYMDTAGENPRGLHATALLQQAKGLTAESLNRLAYDTDMPAFPRLLPALIAAYDRLGTADPRRAALKQPIATLKAWNHRTAADSVAMTLAVNWAERMWKATSEVQVKSLERYDALVSQTDDAAKLTALTDTVETLTRDFGRWQVPWGEVNRFQRISPAIASRFDDAGPSIPVALGPGTWGALASFATVTPPGLKRRHGVSGSSFVAVVEFGKEPKARAVSAGGESGDPASPHFTDQAQRYADGVLRPVYLTEADLAGHVERRYHPGEVTTAR